MHVCQIIDAFTHDGAQRIVVNFAEQARINKVQVTAIGLKECNSSVVWDELENLGVKVCLSTADKLYDPKRMWQLVHFLREHKVDVIQSHLSYANILSPVVGRLAGIPVVSTLHTANFRNQYYRPIIFRTEMLMLRSFSQGVIAVARAVSDVYRKFLGKKEIIVIPNPVKPVQHISETEKIAIRKEFLSRPDAFLLISVGRLAAPKGYPDLIEAFIKVLQVYPESRLIIAGQGDLRGDLEKQIAENYLIGRIILLGDRSDVPTLLSASDLFVSASHWEGMPVSILEAMSAELPVIATGVGGVPEILQGHGIIVAPKKPDVLASTIIDLLGDPDKMKVMGLSGREYVTQNHSLEKWFDELMHYFQMKM